MREKGALMVRMQIRESLMENGMRFLEKYKNKMSIWPQNPASHFPKRIK